jgi:hypothetical protein
MSATGQDIGFCGQPSSSRSLPPGPANNGRPPFAGGSRLDMLD